MDISPKKRASIVTLAEHTNKSQREIAKISGISQSAVSKILRKKKLSVLFGHQESENVAENGKQVNETTMC